ncbi:MAG: NACHT domain-containing protein [Planctomycetota bacterium]
MLGQEQHQPLPQDLRRAFNILVGFDFDGYVQGDPTPMTVRVDARPAAELPDWINQEPVEHLEARISDLLELMGWVRPQPSEYTHRILTFLSENPQANYGHLFEELRTDTRAVKSMAGKRSLGQRMCESTEAAAPDHNPSDQSELVDLLPRCLDLWEQEALDDTWQASGLWVGDKQLGLSELYVDVSLYGIDHDWNAKEPLPSRHGSVQSESMYSSIPQLIRAAQWGDTAVVVGDPGAGKTALSKKITLDIIQHEGWGYAGAIWISLRRWATGPFVNKPASLFQTFLKPYCPTVSAKDLETLAQGLMMRCYRTTNTLNHQDPVLVILDGWDEVPKPLRTKLSESIRSELRNTPLLITSRPHTELNKFNTLERFKIGRLSPVSQQMLIQRFFEATEAPTLGQELSERLKHWRSGRYYADNPFLLSLLCHAWLTQQTLRIPEGHETVTRASLYRMGIEGILTDQTYRGLEAPLSRKDLVPLETMSRELLFDHESRRYVFDDRQSGIQSLQDQGTYEAVSESRLLTRDLNDSHRLEFVHASLQEYLAACSISELSETQASGYLKRAGFLDYVVVFRFLIGMQNPRVVEMLLETLGGKARHPDEAGLIDLVLAELLAELNITDGLLTPLGVDIRKRIWDRCCAGIDPDRQFRALAELDPSDLARRLLDRIERPDDPKSEFNEALLQLDQYLVQDGHLRRIEEQADGSSLIQRIEQALPGSIASLSTIDELRHRVIDHSIPTAERSRALGYLAQWKDAWIERTLRQYIKQDTHHDQWPALMDALKTTGGPHAADVLCDLLVHSEPIQRLEKRLRSKAEDSLWLGGYFALAFWKTDGVAATVADRLRDHVEATQRDRLMWSLLSRSAGTALAPHRLAALENITLSHATRLLTLWVTAQDSDLGKAAMIALQGTSSPDASRALAQIAKEEVDDARRCRALFTMIYGFVLPQESEWLAQRAADTTIDDGERELCIDVLACAARRGNNKAVTVSAHKALAALFEQTPWPEVFPPLIQQADALAPAASRYLYDFIRHPEAKIGLKSEACDSLREIYALAPEKVASDCLTVSKFAIDLAVRKESEPLLQAAARLMVAIHPPALLLQKEVFSSSRKYQLAPRAIIDNVLREWSREHDVPIIDGQPVYPEVEDAHFTDVELDRPLLTHEQLRDLKKFHELSEIYLRNAPLTAFKEYATAWFIHDDGPLSVSGAYEILKNSEAPPDTNVKNWQRQISRAKAMLLAVPCDTLPIQELREFGFRIGVLDTDWRRAPRPS